MYRTHRLAFAAAALALAATSGALACRDVNAPNENPATTTYAPSLGVNLSQMKRTADGLYYQDLAIGTGKQAVNDSTLKVYYTGWLTSGHQFDSNVGKTVFTFVLGQGQVIPGWDQGILAGDAMRVGGRRRLVVPPALGYGGRTYQSIPAGSVLVFDISLVQVGGT